MCKIVQQRNAVRSAFFTHNAAKSLCPVLNVSADFCKRGRVNPPQTSFRPLVMRRFVGHWSSKKKHFPSFAGMLAEKLSEAGYEHQERHVLIIWTFAQGTVHLRQNTWIKLNPSGPFSFSHRGSVGLPGRVCRTLSSWGCSPFSTTISTVQHFKHHSESFQVFMETFSGLSVGRAWLNSSDQLCHWASEAGFSTIFYGWIKTFKCICIYNHMMYDIIYIEAYMIYIIVISFML